MALMPVSPPSAGQYNTQFTDKGGFLTESWKRFLTLWFGQGAGANGTIALAKLTGGGTNGSITVQNGIITGFVNPT